MSGDIFLQPRITGKRFENHSIPLDFLPDLAALQDIFAAIAKHEYKKSNPGRQRIPKDFIGGIEMGMSAIEEGSAMPVLNFLFAVSMLLPNHPAIPYFEKAKTSLVDAIEAAAEGKDVANIIPKSAMPFFNVFGRGLKDDESIAFSAGDKTVAYTKLIREKILLQNIGDAFCQKMFYRGYVTVVSRERMEWTFLTIEGKKITAVLDRQFEDTIHEALKGYTPNSFTNTKIAITADVEFNASAARIVHIEDMVILDPRDIGARLDEIKLLKNGWFDGINGQGFAPEKLDWLASTWDWFCPETLPFPCLFPTIDGKIQAEWKLGDFDVVAEIDCGLQNACCNLMNMSNGADTTDDRCFTVDLKTSGGWEQLFRELQKLQNK